MQSIAIQGKSEFFLGCSITILFSSDMSKLVGTRQQLDAQLNENKVVQEVKAVFTTKN